jgi:hypothetical protein
LNRINLSLGSMGSIQAIIFQFWNLWFESWNWSLVHSLNHTVCLFVEIMFLCERWSEIVSCVAYEKCCEFRINHTMRGANWNKQPNYGNHNNNYEHKLNYEKVNGDNNLKERASLCSTIKQSTWLQEVLNWVIRISFKT